MASLSNAEEEEMSLRGWSVAIAPPARARGVLDSRHIVVVGCGCVV